MAGSPVQSFTCPQCSGAVTVRAKGLSLAAVCGACGSVIDPTHPTLQILSTFEKNHARKPRIPLGSKGVIGDAAPHAFTVVGFVRRCDAAHPKYKWSEYLLFHPLKGYRWLVENEGHWSFVKTTKRKPQDDGYRLTLDGVQYKPYLKGGAKDIYALGEFPWRIKQGEKVKVADAVAPPYMLSMERSEDEVVWSVGTYVSREAVEAAFGVSLAEKKLVTSVAPNQPNPYRATSQRIKVWVASAATLLLVVQLATCSATPDVPLTALTLPYDATDATREWTSDEFEVPGDNGLVEATLSVPSLTNAWLAVSYALIETTSGNQLAFSQEVGQYTGVEDGYAWVEGTTYRRSTLANVPGGRYRLAVEVEAAPEVASAEVAIGLTRVRHHASNFFATLGLILIWPLVLAMRGHAFETRRWANSDLGDD